MTVLIEILNCTPVTPTVSLAVAENGTVFKTMAFGSGNVIDTTGAVMSGGAGRTGRVPQPPLWAIRILGLTTNKIIKRNGIKKSFFIIEALYDTMSVAITNRVDKFVSSPGNNAFFDFSK